MPRVQAYVYDITQGMAKQMSMALVGKQVDIVPHTGIVVFGKEYFFGCGPCIGEPGNTVGMPPAEVLDLGETGKTVEELEAHIQASLAQEHTAERYNLCTHNCNHYADDIVKFLLDGNRLPSRIVNVADEALSTPQGQSLRMMVESMEAQMRGNMGGASAMNPFGNVAGAAGLGSNAAEADEDAELQAALAMSLGGGPSAGAAPAAPSTPAAESASVASEVQAERQLPVPPADTVTLDSAVRDLLRNPRDAAKEALSMVISITEKIIHKPQEDKFRRLKQSNKGLIRKLTGLPGGCAVLISLGFTEDTHEGEAIWRAPRTAASFDQLIDGKARLMIEYERLLGTPIDEEKQKQMNAPGGIDGMIQNALKDPASLQRLLSNPMVASMARANPQLIEGALSNPAVQQTLQEHPEMRAQVEQLIGRPLPGAAAAPQMPPVGAGGGFEPQLAQLAEMGFCDRGACLAALQSAGGDVELALAQLVS
mmetsp:Transcript_84921/g.150393  ORF Transcript_84921/g.150393 Transcript_84921/m.150393 type:complete len:481 (-) Transcript_84921:10-1452(-)